MRENESSLKLRFLEFIYIHHIPVHTKVVNEIKKEEWNKISFKIMSCGCVTLPLSLSSSYHTKIPQIRLTALSLR